MSSRKTAAEPQSMQGSPSDRGQSRGRNSLGKPSATSWGCSGKGVREERGGKGKREEGTGGEGRCYQEGLYPSHEAPKYVSSSKSIRVCSNLSSYLLRKDNSTERSKAK